MSDIFISYARDDRATARMLNGVLEATGYSVFWDREVPPGRTWRDYIGQELEQARCMIVLWSKVSVGSHWVLEEAEIGRKRNILIPVRVDDVMLPLGFQSLQAADLLEWDGMPGSPAFKILLAAIEAKLGAVPVLEEEPPATDVGTVQEKAEEVQPLAVQPSEPEHKRFLWWIVAVSSAVLLIVGMGVWWAVSRPFPLTLDQIRERVEQASVEYPIEVSKNQTFYSSIGISHVESDHVVCTCVGNIKSRVTSSKATIEPDGDNVLIRFKSGAVLVSSPEEVRKAASCSLRSSGGYPGTKRASSGQRENLQNEALRKLVEDALAKKKGIVKETTEKAKALLTELAGSLGLQATVVFDEPVYADSPSS